MSTVTKKRVAAGRTSARRWELYRDGEWIGDMVHWIPEQAWEFQPEDHRDPITGASEAEVILKAGLAL